MTNQYIPLSEAMQRLGISKATMAKLVRTGKLPVFKSQVDTRKKLVLISDVEKLKTVYIPAKETPAHD